MDPVWRRTQLVDAAAHLFARHGYANVSVEQIAEAVGLLKGSFYHHFDSKRELLAEIILASHRDGLRMLDRVEGSEAAPGRERVERYIREHAEWIVHHPDRAGLILREATHLPRERSAEVVELRRRFSDFLAAEINIGQERAELEASLDARVAANGVLGMLNWLGQWYWQGGELSEGRVVAQLVHQALQGLLPADGAHRSSGAVGRAPTKRLVD